MSVVIPDYRRPGTDTSLGNHEARLRALERQRPPEIPADVDFEATFIDAYIQHFPVPANSYTVVDFSSATPGQAVVATNDIDGTLQIFDPATAATTITGDNFAVDYPDDPTIIRILAAGFYIASINVEWFRNVDGVDEPITLPFTGQVNHFDSQPHWGAEFGTYDQRYLIPDFNTNQSIDSNYSITPDLISSGLPSRAVRLKHNSSEITDATVELSIHRIQQIRVAA